MPDDRSYDDPNATRTITPAAADLAYDPFEAPPDTRWWQSKAMRRFRRNPLAIAGVALLIFYVGIAVFAPVITAGTIAERERGHTCARDLDLPRDGAEATAALRNPLAAPFWKAIVAPPQSCLRIPRVSFSPIPQPPSEGHPMGIASGGYDIFYGVIWGARMAFYVGILVSAISFGIGIIIGGAAGFLGGWVDDVLMRFTGVIFAFPNLILAAIFVTIFGPSLTNSLVALAIVGWTNYARLFRGDILRVRNLDFVDAARGLGASRLRTFFRHVFPNSIGSLIIVASLDIGAVVLVASTLAFLGLGAEIGTADWGQMVSFARGYIQGAPGEPFKYWYISWWPGVAIVVFVLAWNLLGDAYRDVFDPRDA
jgi:peptide/nickel transport system permease protein